MREKKFRAFISYARSDGEEFATNLRKRLERGEPEVTVWQDRAGMQGGLGWWSQIKDSIEHSVHLVLVMTPGAIESEWTRKEWLYAREKGVCVVPVKGVGDSKLPYDKIPRWMLKSHFFDIEKEWDSFSNQLRGPCTISRAPYMAPEMPKHFVERPKEYDQLIGLVLDKNRQDPVTTTTALHGAGGFGKTTLATALCHDDKVISAYSDGILWVTLGEKPNILGALTKMYAALTEERPQFVDEDDATHTIKARLRDKDCLVVVDDVRHRHDLKRIQEAASGCSILVTTRLFDVASEGIPLTVDQMTSDESVEILISNL